MGGDDLEIWYFFDYEIARIILEFILKFYKQDSNEVFDWSFQGHKGESFDLSLSQEIAEKIKYKHNLRGVCEPTENKETCPIHLNPIVLKIVSEKISNPLESKF